MTVKVRHVISTNGRMPSDPLREPASGVVGAVLSLAMPQARAGYQVEVWGWNDTRPAQRAVWNGVRMWQSPEWKWARFARWDLRWLAPVWLQGLTQGPVDVLHAHVDPNLLYTPGTRVRLLHLQTPVPDPFPLAYQHLLHRADAVVCCSEFIRARFLAASHYPAGQTSVVYNGADLSAYRPAEGLAQRTQLGFQADDFVVLYVGAVVPQKGVAHLVRAFAQVQSSVPNAALVIVGGARLWATPGGDPSRDAYETQVRELARGLNVHFVGRLPRGQVPAVYTAADVVVIPSVWDDPHPTVVCEAMAAGRPVVASRAGGITETVQHGQTGILVSPADEAQLADAIIRLALDTELRQRMGEAARERAQAFTWEVSAQRLNSIYEQLLTTLVQNTR